MSNEGDFGWTACICTLLRNKNPNRKSRGNQNSAAICNFFMATRDEHHENIISIPEEIVMEILSRLPIKSLFRFRCVSKLWRSLISHPDFTLSFPTHRHLYSTTTQYSEFYYLNDEQTSLVGPIPLKQMLLNMNNGDVITKQDLCRRVQILGSCNGLLLISYCADLYLWNPATRQCTKVLSLSMRSDGDFDYLGDYHFMGVSGLCYDSYSDDYKAVTVDIYDGLVNVISFRRKKWDKMNCSLVNEVDRESLNSGAIVNNKLHWLITGVVNPNSHYPTLNGIVYFDPLTDEFVGLPMPPGPENGKHSTIILGSGVLEGCLCLARYVCEGGDQVDEPGYLGNGHDFISTCKFELESVKPIFIEVLVMKEHGVVESWTRAFIISKDFGILPRPYYNFFVPLCFTKNGEVLVSVNGQLLVYNADEISKRDILLGNELCYYTCSYTESLASPEAYCPEEDWIVQGPDACNFFFYSYTDWEDISIEEEDTSNGYCSEKESFYSTKEDSFIEEEDTSYGYCSDKESFHSTIEDSSIEEDGNCVL